MDLCRKRDIFLIEDAAHAIGTRYKGTYIGGICSTATVFSFHPIKNMTTAEGGMITCHDEGLSHKLALCRFHGISRDAWKAYGSGAVPLYDLEFPSLKFNLTDLQSAIGRVQLKKLESFNARRKQIARQYLDELTRIDGLDLPAEEEEQAWHLFVVKINGKSKITRDDFALKLKEWNIGVGIHFLAVNSLSFFRVSAPNATPMASQVGNTCVSLPLYPLMSDDDVDYVIGCIKELMK
jgi:dTDP-4-amino-4,6-dideoxygalactose transaminase